MLLLFSLIMLIIVYSIMAVVVKINPAITEAVDITAKLVTSLLVVAYMLNVYIPSPNPRMSAMKPGTP